MTTEKLNPSASTPDAVTKKERVPFLPTQIGTDYSFKRKLVWFNIIGFILLHILAIMGAAQMFKTTLITTLFATLIGFIAGVGTTAGAHRYYTHRTYKATIPLQMFLLLAHTVAGQNCMYIWVRDHRQHHKFSDTDADPHNAHRGFFFSHIGWLLSRKHPYVKEKGKKMDLSDLEADPLLMWQKKYYKPLYVIFAILIPVAIPVLCWNETWKNSMLIVYFGRNIMVLHITWLVNSAAHLYGTKPYDKNMLPVENAVVNFFTWGEGWHNYHHAFPWDYRAGEFGLRYSFTTIIIDAFAYFGWAYDLKDTPSHIVKNRMLRTGDGSHHVLLEGEAKQMQVVDDVHYMETEEYHNQIVTGGTESIISDKFNHVDNDSRLRTSSTKG